nr:ATP-binding protein [Lachnospiraceae bacterium]
YGFKDDSSNHIDIKICVKEGKMLLNIRDDCKKFSPIDYMNQFAGHRPDNGLGITMISNLASDIKYLNTFGLNIVHITA